LALQRNDDGEMMGRKIRCNIIQIQIGWLAYSYKFGNLGSPAPHQSQPASQPVSLSRLYFRNSKNCIEEMIGIPWAKN
jgi:hypothetical protein